MKLPSWRVPSATSPHDPAPGSLPAARWTSDTGIGAHRPSQGHGDTMKIVNLTPHALAIHDVHGGVLHVPASGPVARVATRRSCLEHIRVQSSDGESCIPVYLTTHGDVVGLPAEQDGTIYVVSAVVASRCPDRRDVYCPGELVRDNEGRVVGCRGLSMGG